jgi:hypothetical protein
MKTINLVDVFKPERVPGIKDDAVTRMAAQFVATCIRAVNREPEPSVEALQDLVYAAGRESLQAQAVEFFGAKLFPTVRARALLVMEATLAPAPKPDPDVKVVKWCGSLGIAAFGVWLLIPALSVCCWQLNNFMHDLLGGPGQDFAYFQQGTYLAQIEALGTLGICLLSVGPLILWKPALLKAFRP